MTERKISGKKYRILSDIANDTWDRISFWTKASDVEFNDGRDLESASADYARGIIKRSTRYEVGTVGYVSTAPSWAMFICSTAGTTASSFPSTYATVSSGGSVVVDGTARFTAYDLRPDDNPDDSSQYMIPTSNVVCHQYDQLMMNDDKFYFDYQNGEYGFNTDPNRGSSTFHSFIDSRKRAYVSFLSNSSTTTVRVFQFGYEGHSRVPEGDFRTFCMDNTLPINDSSWETTIKYKSRSGTNRTYEVTYKTNGYYYLLDTDASLSPCVKPVYKTADTVETITVDSSYNEPIVGFYSDLKK